LATDVARISEDPQVAAEKVAKHDDEVIHIIAQKAYNYAEERAMEVADAVSNYARPLIFG